MVTFTGVTSRISGGKERTFLKAECDCGKLFEVRTDRRAIVFSCGCNKKPINYCIDCGVKILRRSKRCASCSSKEIASREEIKEAKRLINFVDYTGHRSGMLKIVKDSGERTAKNGRLWEAICDCGNTTLIETWHITSSHKTSCGCQMHQGKPHTQEELKKMSEAMKEYWTDEKRLSISGENSVHWKGGVEKEDRRGVNGYRVWRDNVFSRDDYTCQKCGQRGGNLNAHHIKSWKDNKAERLEKDNGVTLCQSCHYNFHGTYGVLGFTPENYYEYIKQEKVA